MRQLQKILFLFVLLHTVFFTTVYAEKDVYRAGILSDYNFSGNDISQYSKSSAYDILNHIDNSDAEFTYGTVSELLSSLESDKTDFICMAVKSDALSPYIDYTDYPSAKGFLAMLTSSDKDLYFGDFAKFDGIRVALLNNSYFEDMLREYSAENGFTYESVYCSDIEEMQSALASDKADVLLSPVTDAPDGMRLVGKCGEIDYYMAVKKGNWKMLGVLNNALFKLKQGHPFYLSQQFEESFNIPYRNMPALSENDLLAAKHQGELRVLVPTDNYPMAYYDKETRDYRGIYVDILKQIAENTGLQLKYVPDDQPDMTLNSIEMGRSDIILSASGAVEGITKVTEPYTHISYLPVARSDQMIFEDSELSVGILKKDKWISDYIRSMYPQWTIEEYPSINSLLRAVERKKLSMTLIATPDLQTKTSLIAHPKLAIVNDFSLTIPVRLGVSALTCHYSVVNMLNKTISSVAVPQSEFENKVFTLSNTYVPNFFEMMYTNRLWLLIALLLVAMVIVIAKVRELRFRKMALTDQLTSIPNKLYFFEAVQRHIDRSPSRPYLLCTVDAKNFKLVNDRFGRLIGDQTLCSIAQKLKALFKGNAVYARAQGDSFLIFTEDTMDSRRRIASIADLDIHIHNSTKYHVLLKAGVCPIELFDHEIGLDNYIDRAVIAKAHTPSVNKSSVVYFTKAMEDKLNVQNELEIKMDKALENNEFIIYYQPKYELKTDNIIGAEALVRWRRPDGSIISPGMFIPLFEKNGFIVELDFYVYEQVLKLLKSRLNGMDNVVPISVNVSRCHLGDAEFVNKLEALVNKYGVPKQYIEMEITESSFSAEDTTALALIRELKEHGFTISMDDFGSGYSSLNLLREVPIDTLKIDKAFIDNAHDSPRGRVIVEEIITMASKINIKTICEGVETALQRDFLKDAGCNMVQGFLYAKPMPSNDFEGLLSSCPTCDMA